jgi:hypothetical protein
MLPIRIWGVDAHSLPFMQLARVRNISSGGAVVLGMRRRIRPGEVLEVQSGEGKAQFRVVWVGRDGGRAEGEIGIQVLPSEPDIWQLNPCSCPQFAGTGLGTAFC